MGIDAEHALAHCFFLASTSRQATVPPRRFGCPSHLLVRGPAGAGALFFGNFLEISVGAIEKKKRAELGDSQDVQPTIAVDIRRGELDADA